MALKENGEIYLYTALDSNANDGYTALMHFRNNQILHKHLHYSEPNQYADILTSIGTWFPDMDKSTIVFPFVVYTERWEFTDDPPQKTRIVIGLSNILSTDWAGLLAFKG